MSFSSSAALSFSAKVAVSVATVGRSLPQVAPQCQARSPHFPPGRPLSTLCATVASDTPGARLRAALDEKSVSIRSLAIKLAGKGAAPKRIENVRGQIHEWKRGREGGGSNPGPVNARRLAKALDLPADYFIQRDGEARAAGASSETADLRESLEELKATVADQGKSLASLRRRIARLERPPQAEAGGTPQEVPGP